MLETSYRLWHQFVRLVGHYSEVHRIARFAGNLESVAAAYAAASNAEVKTNLSQQFDAIVDQLTMPNGVTKTTYADRYTSTLSAALAVVQLPRLEIDVLDLPASSGIACLSSLALLQENYCVKSYVLGDRYHGVLYDPNRRCVFDEQGNLLQVGFRRFFFSLYRCGILGGRKAFFVRCASFPHRVVAWLFRWHYRFEPKGRYQRLLLVHPRVRQIIDRGVCRLEEMDIFEKIPGRYDLILSFHLLQRLYFSQTAIEAGIRNLAAALSEGGLLIVGNADSFVAYQEQNGSLVPRLREG
jgi:hypothetical protein